MSKQTKLEQVLNLLLNEDTDQASELLHLIIVEKARNIYESIVDEEEMADDMHGEMMDEAEEGDEVGGEPNKEFSKEIAADKDEIDSDELMDGEAEEDEDGDSDEHDGEFGAEDEMSTEEKVEDLESQLAELRAEFDALMGEEMQEPQHADLPAEFGEIEGEFGGDGMDGEMDEMSSMMYEKKKAEKLKNADEKKKKMAKDKKMDEETQFLKKTADTGQKGTAKLVGTGKDSPLGAEQMKSVFSKAPNKPSYGGDSKNILGSKSTGGEYGKYHGDKATDDTPTDNIDVMPKKDSTKADTTPKWTGGKAAGEAGNKSPLSKKPRT